MARFLRDIRISNIVITEASIRQISEVFAARADLLRAASIDAAKEDGVPFLTFILRFDDKGYRFFSVDDLMPHFQRAEKVERLIVTVETGESLRNNRVVGEHLELRLDKYDPNTCYLSVTSDNSDWVDASFAAVQEVLSKCRTRNGWARSAWSTLSIQLMGVFAGFCLSVWAAVRVSEKLTIENAFAISFLFALLVFSNAWSYINGAVLRYVHSIFPNITFYREERDRVDWFMQAIIGGIAATFAAFVLAEAFSYLGTFFAGLTK